MYMSSGLAHAGWRIHVAVAYFVPRTYEYQYEYTSNVLQQSTCSLQLLFRTLLAPRLWVPLSVKSHELGLFLTNIYHTE